MLKNHVFGSLNLNNSEIFRFSFEDIFLRTLDTYTKKMNPPSAVLGEGVCGKVCWLIAYIVIVLVKLIMYRASVVLINIHSTYINYIEFFFIVPTMVDTFKIVGIIKINKFVYIRQGGPRIFKVYHIFILMIVSECLGSIFSKSTFLCHLFPFLRMLLQF